MSNHVTMAYVLAQPQEIKDLFLQISLDRNAHLQAITETLTAYSQGYTPFTPAEYKVYRGILLRSKLFPKYGSNICDDVKSYVQFLCGKHFHKAEAYRSTFERAEDAILHNAHWRGSRDNLRTNPEWVECAVAFAEILCPFPLGLN